MPFDIEQLLERSRKELLDLSTRNRLLSIPVGSKSARVVRVVEELSEQVFRLLVTEGKSLSFLPVRRAKSPGAVANAGDNASDPDDEEVGLPQPEDEANDETGVPKRHVDCRLQTALSPEGLQARLLTLCRDAQTMIEEQGVNILYLALGHLKWFEADHADTPRYAPLILVPVEIWRKSASERFYIRRLDEDVQENLSLRAKLTADFNIQLPDFPDEEDFDLVRYLKAVTKAVNGAKGWEVLPDAMTLGFFSFAKFLMYRDLEPENWPDGEGPLQHAFVTGLLRDGFPLAQSLFSEEAHLDELIPAARLDHVVDADSSQSMAIEAVRQGRSVVIQGPPGTGKSQSIANIIATAVLDGKRVLFVAEKLAALEVVKRRLKKEGLGDLCLELHSNKSNKRAVVEEIGRTWKLGRPKSLESETLVAKLERSRAILNSHAQFLHEHRPPGELTPYTVIGQLTLLGNKGREAAGIKFTGAEDWAPDARQERRQLIGELAERIQGIGVPSRHPWRGICCDVVLAIDLDQLETLIRSVLANVEVLRKTVGTLAHALGQPSPETFSAVEQQRLIAGYVAAAPPLDKQTLCNGVWDTGLEGLNGLLAEGRKFEQNRTDLAGRVLESAWEQDLSDARTHITAHGRSWFRIFNKDYRRSLAQLRGLTVGDLPKAYDERVALTDQIIDGQRARRAIHIADPLGQTAFGKFWRREKSDWTQLGAILDWVGQQRILGLGESFRRMFSGVQDQQAVARLCEELSGRLATARAETAQLFQQLSFDCVLAFGAPDIESVSMDALTERYTFWASQMEELLHWNQYFVRTRRAKELGLGGLVERFETGTIDPEGALHCFDRVYYSQLLREFMRQNPALAQFDGVLHERRVEAFCELDKERLALSRHRVLMAHFDRLPPAAGVGPVGILRGEMERKRGHRTVRRLLKDAGSVVQAIKPVFMMSPLSVAQFLEPGTVEFDLLVVDEASQVQPVDALGAIARCNQIVVVGDSRQLPPTRFFTRMTSDVPELEDEEASANVAEARDVESILGLCCARGLPQTMLRWHYRSRHHSLIAVSNHEFYEDRLFIVPSPHPSSSGLGLRFNPVPEGVFDSGASGTNRVEAKAVCNAVIEHARQSPELSLGVAAFSVRQQQAILDELELLRRENPDTESFFSSHADEPFFIKNLENVQGDERDVIFISVGYGKNAHGYMAMRFGPLSNEGGERRLNVLISRAKNRCEVFSSIVAEDIDLERASGRGVAALKTFLTYAKTDLLAVATNSGREEESPFEEAVRRAIESLGHEVHPQVGVAGFYIDLAVRDPAQPGHYLLGIECDGATYHSSRSARDRDRLRQAVLEDHGWTIHRIWSTDWFQHPAEQLRKVQQAIEGAKERGRKQARPDTAPTIASDHDDDTEPFERENANEMEDAGLRDLAAPYIEANFPVPERKDPHEINTSELAEIVLRIVREEGPVHEDEVVARVRDLWGLGRAGNRIQDSVAKAIRSILVTGACTREHGFLSISGLPVRIRNRQNVSSPNLRKPDTLPPAEIRAAILALIDANHGATVQEIPVAVARIFGFKSTSSQLRSAIEAQTAKLQRQALIQEGNGMLKRTQP
jgi:very-short-patch-repair endonuclease